MDTTGDRIRRARLRKSMTQTELGERLGLKTAAINKYETGLVVNLKRQTIAEMAKVLDVRPAYLMCWQDDPEVHVEEGGDIHLSEMERSVVIALRAMTEKQKKLLLTIAKQMLDAEIEGS